MRVDHARLILEEFNSYDDLDEMAEFFLGLYPPHQMALVGAWTSRQPTYDMRETFRKAAARILQGAT